MYRSNNRKSIMEGFFGAEVGLMISAVVGGVIVLYAKSEMATGIRNSPRPLDQM